MDGTFRFTTSYNGTPVTLPPPVGPARPARPVREAPSEIVGSNWIDVYSSYLSDLRREGFMPGIGGPQDRKHGGHFPFYRTEAELNILRAGSRLIAGANQHGGGLLGGLSAYVIDTGMIAKCTPRDGTKDPADKALCEATQAVLDEFTERNSFDEFQIAAFVESQHDGDFYADLFNEGGRCSLRSVLPELVKQPVGSDPREWSFGHRTPLNDQQNTVAYHVSDPERFNEGEVVPATLAEPWAHRSIVHLTAFLPGRNPRGIKRGIPLFAYGTRDAIDSSEKLLRNMGLGTAARVAYAFVREWAAEVPQSAVSGIVEEKATFRASRPFRTGSTRNVEWLEPGHVEDMPESVKFVPPPSSPETQHAIVVLDALYRAAGQLWNAPEWLMSGNASNMAAYTASLVAKSPFVKRCRQGQAYYRRRFLTILNAVVRFAVWAGLLPEAVLTRVKVDLTAPTVEEEKRLEAAQIDQIYVGMGVKSRQKIAEEQGIDFQRTLEDNKEFLAETGGGDPGSDGGDPPPDGGGGGQQIPMPGAVSGEPEAGDLDPFGDVQEGLRTPLYESAGFTGVKTYSNGAKHYYQDGKHVASPSDEEKAAIEAKGEQKAEGDAPGGENQKAPASAPTAQKAYEEAHAKWEEELASYDERNEAHHEQQGEDWRAAHAAWDKADSDRLQQIDDLTAKISEVDNITAYSVAADLAPSGISTALSDYVDLKDPDARATVHEERIATASEYTADAMTLDTTETQAKLGQLGADPASLQRIEAMAEGYASKIEGKGERWKAALERAHAAVEKYAAHVILEEPAPPADPNDVAAVAQYEKDMAAHQASVEKDDTLAATVDDLFSKADDAESALQELHMTAVERINGMVDKIAGKLRDQFDRQSDDLENAAEEEPEEPDYEDLPEPEEPEPPDEPEAEAEPEPDEPEEDEVVESKRGRTKSGTVLLEAGFTGEVTDSIGRKRHYVDGKPVAGKTDKPAAKEEPAAAAAPSGAFAGDLPATTHEELDALSDALPPEVKRSTARKLYDGVSSKVFNVAVNLSATTLRLLPDVIDLVDDILPGSYAKANDALNDSVGVGSPVAVIIASHAVARVVSLIKKQLGKGKVTTEAEGSDGDQDELVQAIIDIVKATHEAMGVDGVLPTLSEVKQKMAARAAKSSAPVKEADSGFTGVKTYSNGAKHYYQNGKHVSAPSDEEKAQIEAAGEHHGGDAPEGEGDKKPAKKASKKAAGDKPAKAKKAGDPEKAPPGSQMPEELKAKLRELGMTGSFPPADIPMDKIKVADLSRGKEALQHEAFLTWTQVSPKSGRESGQRRYTQEFHDRNAAEKHERVAAIQPHIDKIAAGLTERMADESLPQVKREAAAIANVIRETGLRPTDGDESIKHGHFGISSLQARHMKVVGDEIHLDFIGKEGVRNTSVISDPANVAFIKAALAGKSGEAFVFEKANSNHAGDMLKELSKAAGGPDDIKVKDLRTLKAHQVARQAVADFPGPPPPLSGDPKKDAKAVAKAILEMSGKVSDVLNNEPTESRDTYIHPEIFKQWQSRLSTAS